MQQGPACCILLLSAFYWTGSSAIEKPLSPQIYNKNRPDTIFRMMEEFRISDKGMVYRPGKLLCIGRNYARHAAELGNPVPTVPMVFLKPASSLIGTDEDIVLHPMTNNVHHEVELVCVMGKKGKDIEIGEALDYVAGYAVGLDMTARDIQSAAKAKGDPWSVAKGFDTFAPLGAFISSEQVPDPQNLAISLSINSEVRQRGHTSDMIFPVRSLIAWCSHIFTLMPGDLIFTGTPPGVGSVSEGDKLLAQIQGFPDLRVGVRKEHPQRSPLETFVF